MDRDPEQFGDVLRKLTAEVERDGAGREATLEDALPVWRDLHAALRERMRADGHSTDHPLDDWQRIERGLRDFDARLTQLRMQEAERRVYDAVPDLDGRAIHPRELEEAQERLILHDRQPGSRVRSTPRPERMPVEERADARAAVDRQNALDVPEREADAYRLAPQESRLDWLDQQKPADRLASPPREDRLDWLDIAETDRDQHTELDRDRER